MKKGLVSVRNPVPSISYIKEDTDYSAHLLKFFDKHKIPIPTGYLFQQTKKK